MIGKRRRYWYPLPEKHFDMEFTAPEHFSLEKVGFEASGWGGLLLLIAKYLSRSYPKSTEELFAFRTTWSRAEIFLPVPHVNCELVREGCYMNLNHTSLHCIWLIIDLLGFFGVEPTKCKLLMRRMPRSEPEEVREAITLEIQQGLKTYLAEKKSLSLERIQKVISNLDYANRFFHQMRSGYNNFYLIDSALMFSNMKAKFLTEYSKKDLSPGQRNTAVLKKQLGYLNEYLREKGYYLEHEGIREALFSYETALMFYDKEGNAHHLDFHVAFDLKSTTP